MRALDLLDEDHRQIVRVLDAAEAAVARARETGATDPAFFQALALFIRDFADGAHHAREEDVLFRALEDFGFPRAQGPLHCMLAEHGYGRALRTQLAAAADALAAGTEAALGEVLDAAARYAALLRGHIAKEDQSIYPMAREALPPEAFDTMLLRYREVTRVSAAEFAAAADALACWFGGTPAPRPRQRFTTSNPRVLGR